MLYQLSYSSEGADYRTRRLGAAKRARSAPLAARAHPAAPPRPAMLANAAADPARLRADRAGLRAVPPVRATSAASGSALERLVYYVLFPALLFNSIVAAKYSLAADGGLLAGRGVGALLLGGAARLRCARPLLRPTPRAARVGCVQTAFRYNSYVGLALAQSLAGARGVALDRAADLAVCMPLCQRDRGVRRWRATASRATLRELARNPLILGDGRPGWRRNLARAAAAASSRRTRSAALGAGQPGARADRPSAPA
ncbi:MAG: hypothetical protein MZW92_35205 [Comamonadaceae bacterium]|nr:hypothetical protein [Comamonadaceae bacterium]